MNCRLSAVILIFVVGLVATAEFAIAGTPTAQRVTATATILNGVTNDRAKLSAGKVVVKSIDPAGRVTTVRSPNSRPIIIIDMP